MACKHETYILLRDGCERCIRCGEHTRNGANTSAPFYALVQAADAALHPRDGYSNTHERRIRERANAG